MPRCKMKCRFKTDFDDGKANIHLEYVSDSKESDQTSGYLDLNMLNPEDAKVFVAGKEYFIDITPAK